MTPGLTRGPPFPPKAVKGSVVAIASLERPSVPMVVGVCEIDISSLQEVRGAKGHAVRGEHWDGDEVWAWSQSGGVGGKAPDKIEGWDTDIDMDGLKEQVTQVDIEDSDDEQGGGGVSVNPSFVAAQKSMEQNIYVEGEDGKPYEEVEVDQKEFSTKG